MICGSCKSPSTTIAHVRSCYASKGVPTAPVAVLDRPAAVSIPRQTRPTQTHTADPNVPAARYAVGPADRTLFVKVDRPTEGKWAGRTFVKVLASDTEHPLRDRTARARVLAEIAADIDGALRRYGREIGACGHCGRTLTNAESRAEGIGAVCAGKRRAEPAAPKGRAIGRREAVARFGARND